MNLAYIMASIIGLFVFFLTIKKRLPFTICAICLAVSGVWLALLGLYYSSVFKDPIILALLMGGSVIGLYYAVEKRVPDQYLLFRLPFLLTLFLTAYTTITLKLSIAALLVVVLVWAVLGSIYCYRNKPAVRQTVKNLIECCGKW